MRSAHARLSEQPSEISVRPHLNSPCPPARRPLHPSQTHLVDKLGVTCRVEPLSLGDFVWAVERIQPGVGDSRHGLKLVLDHVVERKRMDDLSSSIIDKRYAEQKSRFKNADFIRSPIYLVEDYGACAQARARRASVLHAGSTAHHGASVSPVLHARVH